MTGTPETNPDVLADVARHTRTSFQQAIRERAARLRKIAEEFDRIAESVDSVPEFNPQSYESYAHLASRAQHAALWGLANLALENLTTDAHDADKFAAELAAARQAITGKED